MKSSTKGAISPRQLVSAQKSLPAEDMIQESEGIGEICISGGFS